VPVSVEAGFGANDTIIQITVIMEYRATARSPSHKQSMSEVAFAVDWSLVIEEVKVGFKPWVLIAANDNTWPIYIQEKDLRILWRVLEQKILDGKIYVGVCGERLVYLMLRGRATSKGCKA
jgi:hypothetical protein